MDIFDISSLYGALLGAVGIYRYQRLDSTRQIFVVYQAINMLTTIAQIILAKQFINSHWTLHVTSAIRYSFFAYILSCGITSLRTRMYFRYSIPAFLVVWLCLELTVENIQSFSIYTRPMEGILLIIGSMVTIHSLNSSSVTPLLKDPRMWFSAGILIYSSGVMVLNLISNSLLSASYELITNAWYLQVACSFIANSLYIVALVLPAGERNGFRERTTLSCQ